MPVEDEIIHWWKDEKGEGHRNALRLETEQPQLANGFPRDGIVTLRLVNTVSQQSMKLSPEEALRISVELSQLAKELIDQKRAMWHEHED